MKKLTLESEFTHGINTYKRIKSSDKWYLYEVTARQKEKQPSTTYEIFQRTTRTVSRFDRKGNPYECEMERIPSFGNLGKTYWCYSTERQALNKWDEINGFGLM